MNMCNITKLSVSYISLNVIKNEQELKQGHPPFIVSDTEPAMEAGELVARDCGAEDTGSSTITSMSLLLSSAGMELGWSSLLNEICRDT